MCEKQHENAGNNAKRAPGGGTEPLGTGKKRKVGQELAFFKIYLLLQAQRIRETGVTPVQSRCCMFHYRQSILATAEK